MECAARSILKEGAGLGLQVQEGIDEFDETWDKVLFTTTAKPRSSIPLQPCTKYVGTWLFTDTVYFVRTQLNQEVMASAIKTVRLLLGAATRQAAVLNA